MRGRWLGMSVLTSMLLMMLLVPAGASAGWGQWVESEGVTETSVTIELYIHPRWPETHWKMDFTMAADGEDKKNPCPTKQPERCDFNFVGVEEQTGTVIQSSPYEVVEIAVPIPGPLYELPLAPAKVYEFSVITYGEGEPTAPEFPTNGGNDSVYESVETPGTFGPEEQANKAKIEKERRQKLKQSSREKKRREGIESKFAKLRAKGEHAH